MVNALSKAIIKLVGKPKAWEEVGSKLAEGINKFFGTWKPEDLATAANAVVDNLKAAIVSLMKKLKWKDILDKVGTFLGNLELDTIGFAIGSFMLLTKAGRKLTAKIFKSLIMTPITELFTSAFGSSAISSAAAGLASVSIPVAVGLAISLKSVEWKESLDKTKDKLTEAFKKGNVSDYISAELENLKNPYNTINSLGGGILDSTNRKTIEEQKKELEKNGAWFGGMMTDEELKQNIKTLQDKIKEFWGEKVKLPVEGSLKNAKENVEQWKADIKQKWNQLKLAVSNKLETTKENLNQFKETLKEKWGTFKLGIWHKLKTTGEDITKFYEKIEKWWGTKKLKVYNTLSTLKKDVSEWWSNVKNWWGEKTLSVKVVFEKITDKIKGAVSSVGNFITGGSKNVAGYSIEMPQYEMADLSWYAKGGIFSNPSVIGVGEAGREAVLPLQNSRAMSMIADSIIDNYSGAGNQGFLGDIKEEIKDAVMQGMMEVFMATKDSQQTVNVTCDARLNVDSETLAKAVMKGQQKLDRRYHPSPRYGY